MEHHYFIGFLVIISCFLEAFSRPSSNEPSILEVEAESRGEDLEDTDAELDLDDDQTVYIKIKPEEIIDEEKVIAQIENNSEITPTTFIPDDTQEETAKEIMEKIKEINKSLKKPQRQKYNYNKLNTGGYILDRDILEKLQKIIANGKTNQKTLESESTDAFDFRYAKKRSLQYVQPNMNGNSLQYVQPNTNENSIQSLPFMTAGLSSLSVAVVPLPYITNIPAMIIPQMNGQYDVHPISNDIQPKTGFMTRQRPTLPFNIPWPLASVFPVLVKDPLLHYLQGGSWDNWLELGQAADVCNRKQKSEGSNYRRLDVNDDEEHFDNKIPENPIRLFKTREGRAIKKRTIAKTAAQQELDNIKSIKKLFSIKKPVVQITTPKPKKKQTKTSSQDTKIADLDQGDLRFPFGDFGLFGQRKPVAPSPGFFINRLKVRRGGVAIAGPGGVATAGRGGAAIVGPGGLAYTQPGGMAVAGPAAKVVALTSDADMSSIVNRLHQQSAIDGSIPRLLQAIPEGRVVATGPVIYYHPSNPNPL